MSYITAQRWLAEVFLTCQIYCTSVTEGILVNEVALKNINLCVYDEVERRAGIHSLPADLGRCALKFND